MGVTTAVVDVEVDASLTAVSWCDGDFAQVASIVSQESIREDDANRIVSNKHSAARTGTEQPCDLANVFSIMNKLQKRITVKHLEASQHPMKKVIVDTLKKHENVLNLATKRKGPLVDFLSTLPTNLTRAATHENIVHGFIQSGMLDKKTQSTPDLFNMIGTVRRLVKTDEVDLCLKTFPTLFKLQLEHGHVTDDVFDQLGYPNDVDPDDNIIRRDGGITKEPYQRAKTLSHEYQRNLRLELKQKARDVVASKLADAQAKTEKILANNRSCESKLCTLMGESSTDNVMFANCSIEHITKCNSDQLKAFIHARKFNSNVKDVEFHVGQRKSRE